MASLESQLAIKVSGLPEVGNRPCLLSLDGGGVRGLSSLHILRYIMTKVNENRSGDTLVKPCQIFDIIGGTSTGGLIAIMLGTLGMDVDECIKAYDTLFEQVFGKKKGFLPTNWRLDVKSAFSSKALRSAVTEIVTKSGRKPDAKFNEGIDHKCKTFVCATSKDTSNTRLLKDYDIPGKPRQNQGMTIVEAAMATSAALSFFDPVKIGDQIYLDGGTGANNPVDRVWNEAQALFGAEDGKIDNVVGCILSIGTGDPGINSFSKNAWKVLTETLRNLATETEATERRFASTHSYLTASTPRYFRFNVQQGLQNVGLAEYKEAGKIKTVTEEYMDHRNKELEVLKTSEILRAKNSAAPPNIKQLVTEFEYNKAHRSHTAEIFKAPKYRVKDFIGRTAELDQLSNACNANGSSDGKPRIVVIRALGGQGKTQLALKFCYQMRGKMPVLWADAQTSKTLKKDLASFAPLLNVSISNNADIDARVDATLTTLQDFPTPWLMVFDNYDDPDSFNNIDHFMPSCSHGIIVITTRHENTLKLADEDFKISLDSLSENDAIELLEVTSDGKDRKGHDRPTKENIVNRLGKHALAVAQAGAYIRDSKISTRDFLQHFEQRKGRVIGDKSEGMNEYRKKLSDNTEVETSMNVFATFELSYSQLSRRGDGVAYHSADVLTLLAFFESKSVSEDLMKSYCEHKDAQLDIEDSIFKPEASSKPGIFLSHHAKAWDPDDYCDVLILLSKMSLTQPFTRHDNNLCSVSLHPLVRDWIRIRTDDINSQKYASFAGTCIYRLLGLTPHPNFLYALSLPKAQELQAHLDIHATDRSGLSSKGLVPVYKTPPLDIGEPELLFGYLADNNGESNKSVWWFQLSLEQRIKAFGNVPDTKAPYYTHEAILFSQHALASAYQANGQISKAVKLFEHVVKIKETTVVETHHDLLASQHELARACQANGQISEAIKLLEHVVKIEETTLAETHPYRLMSQLELASAYQANGQISEAIKLLEHVVKINETTLVETHLDRLVSQHELARAYQANGQISEAIKLLEHVVKIEETTLAETHPYRLISQHELASVYQANGQISEAIKLIEYVVKIRETTLVETHLDRLVSQHELARAYQANGQISEAIKLLEHVVKIEETTLVETHPYRLISQHELARAYQANGQVSEAIKLIEYVVKIRETTLAETHPDRLASQHVLAIAYEANGQISEAIKLLEH